MSVESSVGVGVGASMELGENFGASLPLVEEECVGRGDSTLIVGEGDCAVGVVG